MKKFLVAHPDHFTQRAIEVTLRDLHFGTRQARDGLDAIDQALDDPPDVIVLGTGLPGLNGLDVARAFRALSNTQQIPILFITNDAEDTAEVIGAALPIVDWVQAPLDLTRLRDHIARLLNLPAANPGRAVSETDRNLSAISDPLTGLYARHYMLHRLAYEGARATRYEHEITTVLLAVCDVEQIMKKYGQAAADRAIISTANLLRRSLRVVDLVGRTAVDEFLIIAPHTDLPGATALAKRVQTQLQSAVVEVNGEQFQVLVRVGVAVSENASLADNLALFARAEAALNRARQDAEQTIVFG